MAGSFQLLVDNTQAASTLDPALSNHQDQGGQKGFPRSFQNPFTVAQEYKYLDWVYAEAAATAWPDANTSTDLTATEHALTPTDLDLASSNAGDHESYPDWVYAAAAAVAWPDPQQIQAAGDLRPLEDEAEIASINQSEIAEDMSSRAGGFCGARLRCTANGCTAIFKSKHNLGRHVSTVHSGSRQLFECPVPECPRVGSRGFQRRDNLIQHRRSVHGEDITKVKFRFGERA